MNRTTHPPLALLLLALAPACSRGQGTAEDYRRAAGLAAATRDTVFRTHVHAHWFDGGRRFWYRNDLADGAREWVLVDAEAGKREPAFDHDSLAAALGTGLGRAVEPTRLPLEGVSFPGGAVEFRAGGKRWRFDRTAHTLRGLKDDPPWPAPAAPAPANTTRPGPGTASPDGRYVAFFRDYDVHLRDAKTREEWALSKGGGAADGFGGELWWSPDSKHLVALRTRAGGDRQVHLIESSPPGSLTPRLHSFAYLKPGDVVPLSKPHLFTVGAKKPIPIADDLFPNPWSVEGLRWQADGRRFFFVYNQRGHQVLRVVAVEAATGRARAIVEETSKTFIDYAGKQFLHWLPATEELLWMSERDGWNHLYLYDTRTGRVKNQITRGRWVVRGVDRVDGKARQVWFRAGGIHPRQDPYHVHWARVNLDGTGLVPLTDGDGTHSVAPSPDGRFLIDTFSRVDLAPITQLRRAADGRPVCTLEKADTRRLEATRWRAPERFVAPGRDGRTAIHGIIIRPTTFDPTKKYPVIEDVYAGPHGSFVPKGFRSYHRAQKIAELGFLVVQIDGMGTSNRSKAFHDVCWKNLADSGFPDRIAWLKAAAKKYPEMDLKRVGIYGGSAGGQSSTRALLSHGDFYKVAVSDCGCHDNRVDKVWWNELWMGWPVGPHYRAQSNATDAARLTGKLLLIVGEVDRNVDPACTMQLVAALVKADRDFDLLVLPGVGHGAAESAYGQRRRQDFFVRHLLGVEPRRPAAGAGANGR